MAVRLWSPDTDLARDTSVPLTTLMQQGAAANEAEVKARQLQDADARTRLIQQTIGKHTKIGPDGQTAIDRASVLTELQQRDPVAASQAQQHFVELDTAATEAGDKHLHASDEHQGAQDKHGADIEAQRTAHQKAILQALGSIDPDSPNFEQQRDMAIQQLTSQGIEVPEEDKALTPEQARYFQRTLIGPQHIFDAKARAEQADNKRYTIFHVTAHNGDGSSTDVPHVFDSRTGQVDTIDAATAQSQGATVAPAGWTPTQHGGPSGGNGANIDGGYVWDNFVRQHEGGLNPSDANGAPTLYGFNKTANPDIDFSKFTPEQARQRFIDKYYTPSGAANLPPNMRAVYADTYFISPGMAKSFLARSGNDPDKFMSLREQWMQRLETSQPDKYGKYTKAWTRRNRDLRSQVGTAGPSDTGGAPPVASPIGGTHVDTSRLGLTGTPKPEDKPTMTDDEIDMWAGRMALGDPLPQFSDRKGTIKQKILARTADIWHNAGISPGEAVVLGAQNKAGLAELITVGKVRGLVGSFERTAQANLEQVIKALPGGISSHSPVVNRLAQYWRGQIKGDPDVVRLSVALKTYINEYSKVMTAVNNQSPSDSARHDAASMMNQAMTADQIVSAYNQMKVDMANRAKGLEGQRAAILNQLRTGEGRAPTGTLEPSNSRVVNGPNGTKWRQYNDGRPMERIRG